MSDSDEEDFQFFGTPIEDEEETRQGQHRKEVRDAAATRALPLHQQVRSQGPGSAGALSELAGFACVHPVLVASPAGCLRP